MMSLNPLSSLEDNPPEPRDYVVFGGTFDPLHEGHVSVVQGLQKYFKRIILAATVKNPWKKTQPTDISLRLQMAALVLEAEGVPSEMCRTFCDCTLDQKVCLSLEQYEFADAFVELCRKHFSGTLYWAVGADEAKNVHQWRNWTELEIPTLVAPVVIDIHATDQREGKARVHPAIEEFVGVNGLYGR